MIGITEQLDVYLLPRDGGNPLRPIPFTSATWERVSDAPSHATIEAKAINGDVADRCCEAMDGVNAWAYEVGVYRNTKRCWAGPITAIDFGSDGVTINASDIAAWLGRRWVHQDYSWKNVPLSSMVREIVADAMRPDDVPGLLVYGNVPTMGSRDIKAVEYRVALSEIDDLARSGLDWSVVNRLMVLGDFESANLVPVAFLSDQHFTNRPTVNVDGNMGTRWAVLGGAEGTDEPSVVGLARHNPESVYGVHERSVTDAEITTQKQANQAAEQYRGLLREPSAVFGGGALHPSAPIEMDQLVPGAIFQLGLSQACRAVGGLYRLRKVSGKHDSSGNTIEIECEPVGDVHLEDVQQ